MYLWGGGNTVTAPLKGVIGALFAWHKVGILGFPKPRDITPKMENHMEMNQEQRNRNWGSILGVRD